MQKKTLCVCVCVGVLAALADLEPKLDERVLQLLLVSNKN